MSAIAAAASSWVENMLQLAHLTSAPKSFNVSIRIAVSLVICKDPVNLKPFKGFVPACCFLRDISPGISFSAISILCLPRGARLISFT